MSALQRTPGPSTARIHDLGYKRYVGTRRPQSMRYRTIVRNVIASAWRGWWRMKLWVGVAALTVFVIGTVMYVMGNQDIGMFARGGKSLTVGEALLPWSFSFLRWSAFGASMSSVASIVANDLRAGAFEFYFSRPVRPVDYVAGKLGGALLIMAPLVLVGPVLLSLFRIGLLGTDQIVASLDLVPKTMLVGAVATLVYAAVPLAFSSFSSRSRHALVAWAAYFVVVGHILEAISLLAGPAELAALDVQTSINTLAYAVFDVQLSLDADRAQPPLWSVVAALAGYLVVSLALVHRRVSSAERAGLGGG